MPSEEEALVPSWTMFQKVASWKSDLYVAISRKLWRAQAEKSVHI